MVNGVFYAKIHMQGPLVLGHQGKRSLLVGYTIRSLMGKLAYVLSPFQREPKMYHFKEVLLRDFFAVFSEYAGSLLMTNVPLIPKRKSSGDSEYF